MIEIVAPLAEIEAAEIISEQDELQNETALGMRSVHLLLAKHGGGHCLLPLQRSLMCQLLSIDISLLLVVRLTRLTLLRSSLLLCLLLRLPLWLTFRRSWYLWLGLWLLHSGDLLALLRSTLLTVIARL